MDIQLFQSNWLKISFFNCTFVKISWPYMYGVRIVILKEGIKVSITSLKSQDTFGSSIYRLPPVGRQGARHRG